MKQRYPNACELRVSDTHSGFFENKLVMNGIEYFSGETYHVERRIPKGC